MSQAAHTQTPSLGLSPAAAGGTGGAVRHGSVEGSHDAMFSAIVELSKPGITKLVTLTSGVGFVLASLDRAWPSTPEMLLAGVAAVVGTALSAAGANTLNQWMEQHRDARMRRTARRPLPSGRITPRQAMLVGLLLCATGLLILGGLAGFAPACLSLATILTYLFLYTPMKPRTTLNTLIGAIPGALPPLIGWTAAAPPIMENDLSRIFEPVSWGGWSLFLLMFVWQIPHFLAIAWRYRDDYAAGGYRMLPIDDPSGSRTALTMFIWALAFIPASLAPVLLMPERLAIVYPAVAVVSGLIYAGLALRLVIRRSDKAARVVFFASIMHLPLLLIVMVVDAVVNVI